MISILESYRAEAWRECCPLSSAPMAFDIYDIYIIEL